MSIEDFTLCKVVGKGSYGTVMLARKKDTGEVLAIKMLKKAYIKKRKQEDHTKTERFILETINHPFIVNLKYAFQNKEKLYFCLEFCPGGELFFHLQRVENFDEEVTRFYSAQMVLALEHLHKQDVIYRDLKPENVLINHDGYIKLTDFGLAKENVITNKDAMSFCGTPEYLAPEILDRKAYTTRTDLWSIGILIYEMLFGKHPLANCQDFDQLVITIINNDIQIPPKNNINEISKPCIELVKKMITKNPNKRITWNEFFNHPWLNRFKFKNLQDEPVRINSSESLVSLTKNLNTYDNELEHSQYNINHFRENSKHINIIPDYIPIKIGLGIDNDEDSN
jgi:serum/glucocorticoid-regulated kinase 2